MTKREMISLLLTFLLLVLMAPAPIGCAESEVKLEHRLLDALRQASDLNDEALQELVLNQNDALIPLLTRQLSNEDEDLRHAALFGILLIGGNPAKAVFEAELKKADDVEERAGIRGMLCAVLGSTRSRDDEQFLIESLQGPVQSDEGEVIGAAIEPAALTLGILRSHAAVPALQKCAVEDTWSIAAHACNRTLQWIESPPPPVELPDSAGDPEKIIAAVIHAGVPRMEQSVVFQEADSSRKWIRVNNVWKEVPVVFTGKNTEAPTISFKLHISKDNMRAIVAVGLDFGPLNAKGYTYVLQRSSQGWIVRQIVSTWIS